MTDWRSHWYPVSFAQDLRGDGPLAVSVHDTSFVLFRAEDGRLACLADRCPHRAARLSDGRVAQGRLECLYHGWQFAADGRCEAVPQLPAGRAIPDAACTTSFPVVERQGIVWIWPGPRDAADESTIPTTEELDRPDCTSIDFQMDLPYDQTFLVENVIDIAHIHFAHDGIRGGGRRDLAGPLELDVRESSVAGIRCRFRSPELTDSEDSLPPLEGAEVAFVAPNLVRYRSHYADDDRYSGLALYALPRGRDRCRLLYRAYSNFPRRRDRLTPRAVQHWTQCTILEQDMQLVMGQADEIRRAGAPLSDIWHPIKTSDHLVILYRKWLDEHGSSPTGHARLDKTAPAETFPTERVPTGPAHGAPPTDRALLHTRICSSCTAARDHARLAIRALAAISALALATAAATADSAATTIALAVSISAALAAVAAHAAQQRFE